jgi:hypothetical protein
VRYGDLYGHFNLSAPKPPPLPDLPVGATVSDRQLVDSEYNALRREAIVHFCTPSPSASFTVQVASAPSHLAHRSLLSSLRPLTLSASPGVKRDRHVMFSLLRL